jgi:ABC-type glycerol-3-phosphate transport system permease component
VLLFRSAPAVGLLRRRGALRVASIEGGASVRRISLPWRRSRARSTDYRAPRMRGDGRRSFLVTLIAVLAIAAFLSPMLRSAIYAIKSTDQISQAGTPLYPADPVTFDYQGRSCRPAGPDRRDDPPLALLEPGRKQSTFIDPANSEPRPIVWSGSWRTLEHVWQFAPHFENFAKVWDLHRLSRGCCSTPR